MSKPLSVLIIEDNEGDREYIGAILDPNQEISYTGVGTLREGFECLAQYKYDVILLDLFLPDVYGDPLKAFFELKAYGEKIDLTDVAIIILTGLDDIDVSLEALRAGAQDYFEKGGLNLHSKGLVNTIKRAYERVLHIKSLDLPLAPDKTPCAPERPIIGEEEIEAFQSLKRRIEDAARQQE